MGRPKRQPAPQHVEPEYESQEIPDEPAASIIEPTVTGKPMSKSGAVKAAMAEGIESNAEIADFARTQHGLEISASHIAAEKSRLKKIGGQQVVEPARRGRPPGKSKGVTVTFERGRKPKATEINLAARPAPGGKNGETDLLAAMEAMKPLVAALGAEKTRRIIDLLG